MSWNMNDIPDQSGRIAIVTGANSGLGFETSKALVEKNMHVVMAVRNMKKGEAARDEILEETPSAELDVMHLDLASLDSVRNFAQDFQRRYDRLDLLFNNAGVMAPPYGTTEDGFEMQFGVNHLGHFALTGLLLPVLLKTPNSRVVNTTSFAQYFGWIQFNDLNAERGYNRYMRYGQSKLANMLFTFELQRRLERLGADTTSLAAHPGYAETNLQSNTVDNSQSRIERWIYDLTLPLIAQGQEAGALPLLRAAFDLEAKGGTLYGPRFVMRGAAVRTLPTPQSLSEERARKLWQVSEELTGVRYLDNINEQETGKGFRLSSDTASPQP